MSAFEKWAASQPDAEPDETKKVRGKYKYGDVAYGAEAWDAAIEKAAKLIEDLRGSDYCTFDKVAHHVRELAERTRRK